MWDSVRDWFLGLGAEYGVDPIVFGAIYVGAIPLFTVCLAWTIRNLRRKRPAALPALLTLFFFSSAYLYLLAVGMNIPWWVYGIVAAMVGLGISSTVQRVRRGVREEGPGDG